MSIILTQYCCCDPTVLGACCGVNGCTPNITQELCFSLGGIPWFSGLDCADADCGFVVGGCNTVDIDLCGVVCSGTYTVASTWDMVCIDIIPPIQDPVPVSFSTAVLVFDHIQSATKCDWVDQNTADCSPLARLSCEGGGFGNPNNWSGLTGHNGFQDGTPQVNCHCPPDYHSFCASFVALNTVEDEFDLCPPTGNWPAVDTDTGCTNRVMTVG